MSRLKRWQKLAIAVLAAVAAFFCVGQAVTFSWLSSFPERSERFAAYQIYFWGFGALAIFLVCISVYAIVSFFKSKSVL